VRITSAKTLLGVSVVAVIAISFFYFWPGFIDSGTRTQVAVPAPPVSSPPVTETFPAADTPSEPARVRDLEDRLAEESRARKKAEADAEMLRTRAASLEGKVVVSLGTVADIGKRAGSILPALRELRALTARDRTTLSDDEKRRLLDLQRQHADVLGMLPEIAGFQDNPAEYGSFFRSMVQEATGLTDAQASQVESYMRQRATSMGQLGLNTAKEPTDPTLEKQWEERRDQFNEQTATGLQALLPPGAADKAGINAQLMELLEMDFDKAEAEPTKKK
jgi:hypothetical protein